VTGSALLGAVIGAFVFGRIADVLGRKSVYALVAAIMIRRSTGLRVFPKFRLPGHGAFRFGSRHRRRLTRSLLCS